MNRLMIKRHTQDAVCTPERTAAIAEARDIPDWAVEPYLNDLYTLAKTTNKKRVTFTDYLMDLGERVRPPLFIQQCRRPSCMAEWPQSGADGDLHI